jgi:hypothetical protein
MDSQQVVTSAKIEPQNDIEQLINWPPAFAGLT